MFVEHGECGCEWLVWVPGLTITLEGWASHQPDTDEFDRWVAENLWPRGIRARAMTITEGLLMVEAAVLSDPHLDMPPGSVPVTTVQRCGRPSESHVRSRVHALPGAVPPMYAELAQASLRAHPLPE